MNISPAKNPGNQGTEVSFNEIMHIAMMNYKTGGLREAVSETLDYAAEEYGGGDN